MAESVLLLSGRGSSGGACDRLCGEQSGAGWDGGVRGSLSGRARGGIWGWKRPVRRWTAETWLEFLTEYALTVEEGRSIREATYTGRPLGSGAFVAGLEARLGRKLVPGSGGVASSGAGVLAGQLRFWDEGL